ncbi:MAG: NAD(P)/FAD-dependent oxidoreductase [Candidatus Saccharibacteria bacterium]
MKTVDVAVVGGGPGGMAAAVAAKQAGAQKVLIIERDYDLGGILPQCIHDGFGTFVMKARLTGPEYADHFKNLVMENDIECLLNTMVLDITPDGQLTMINPDQGIIEVQAGAVVLAMGCRERTRTQILIPGTRPAGVYSAGTAQRLVNIEGLMPGKKAVILGSGDIGLIMARRLTLEGVDVEGVYELLPRPSGLTRNIVQCLEDYNIPLHLSHTITYIHGKRRVEGVTINQVDENLKPIKGTERYVECDTVILSVGLIPENELSENAGIKLDDITRGPVVDENMQTSIPGIFACGNVVNVYDLVDYVTYTGEAAGRGAARYAKGELSEGKPVPTVAGKNVQFTVPQAIDPARAQETVNLYFRVRETAYNVRAIVKVGEEVIASKKERVVKPPEMVVVKLPPEKLAKIKPGDKITVDVIEEPAKEAVS